MDGRYVTGVLEMMWKEAVFMFKAAVPTQCPDTEIRVEPGYHHVVMMGNLDREFRPSRAILPDCQLQLAPQCSVLHYKLTVTQLVERFPASCGNQRFITVFTTARNWFLS